MPEPELVERNIACRSCGSDVAPGLLSCPGCHALLFAAELKALAAQAEQASLAGDISGALRHWRSALDLLPPQSVQHTQIQGRVLELSRQLDAAGTAPPGPATPVSAAGSRVGLWGGIAAAVVFLLTKGKFLIAGLTKSGTVFSMLLAFGVYWQIWGWKFAAGSVLAVYIHEMGHVAALRRYGIPFSPPMFLPGIGAIVRTKQYPADAREDANVGLAGPLWGLGATALLYGIFLLSADKLYLALTHFSAFINLFNLLPVGPLDGGRGFRALTRAQRWSVVLAFGAAYWLTDAGMLLLIAMVAALAALGGTAAKEPDRSAFAKFMLLVGMLSLLLYASDVPPHQRHRQPRRDMPRYISLCTCAASSHCATLDKGPGRNSPMKSTISAVSKKSAPCVRVVQFSRQQLRSSRANRHYWEYGDGLTVYRM